MWRQVPFDRDEETQRRPRCLAGEEREEILAVNLSYRGLRGRRGTDERKDGGRGECGVRGGRE